MCKTVSILIWVFSPSLFCLAEIGHYTFSIEEVNYIEKYFPKSEKLYFFVLHLVCT